MSATRVMRREPGQVRQPGAAALVLTVAFHRVYPGQAQRLRQEMCERRSIIG